MLRDDDEGVRRAALNVMAVCSAPERASHMPTIFDGLRDDNWSVQDAAYDCVMACSADEIAPYTVALSNELREIAQRHKQRLEVFRPRTVSTTWGQERI